MIKCICKISENIKGLETIHIERDFDFVCINCGRSKLKGDIKNERI